jgi:hypothetical protein
MFFISVVFSFGAAFKTNLKPTACFVLLRTSHDRLTVLLVVAEIAGKKSIVELEQVIQRALYFVF